MHWADAFTRDLTGQQVISTGISPSGPIHVGNMREILTGDLIYKASVDKGLNSRFIYLCDDMDPLRKVYPFLPQTYSQYVGKPLCAIPAPTGDGIYSEYFLAPFLKTLEVINVKVEVLRTSQLYREGLFTEAIDVVMKNQDRVRKILEDVSGREIEAEWAPYNPICSRCGRINSTSVVSYSFPYVEYSCKCGNTGKADIRKDDGKLPWRIEWPAKWFTLGVTIEPFGKDHGAAGGSYDTGKKILEEIFGKKAPKPLIYERIFLKGKGAMHSSTGINIPASDMVEFAPPEILRFLIVRSQPGRHIDFDPGLGLLNLIDEYEKYEDAYFKQEEAGNDDSRRIYELSRIHTGKMEDLISFRHLITLVQIYPKEDQMLVAIRRNGYNHATITPELSSKIKVVKAWLGKYAPDQVKFSILPLDGAVSLDDREKGMIREFCRRIAGMEWQPDQIHNGIHELIKSSEFDTKEGFSVFYKVLIGKDKGPRLGYFLSNMDRKWVETRFEKVIS